MVDKIMIAVLHWVHVLYTQTTVVGPIFHLSSVDIEVRVTKNHDWKKHVNLFYDMYKKK